MILPLRMSSPVQITQPELQVSVIAREHMCVMQ